MNRGTEVAEAFSFTHGPTPSGAVFDTVRSSGECIQNGASVQCTSDLEAGEVKTFTVAYTVNNAVSCSLARGLQVVTVVQSDVSSISTSVGCVMTNENASQASSASSSSSSSAASFSSSQAAYDPLGGTGAYVAQQYASGSFVGGQVIADTLKDGDEGKGKGYKPYPKPRAGAISDYFLATTEATLLNPVSEQNTPGGLATPFLSVLVLMIVSLAIIGFILFRKKLAKRTLSEQ